MANLLATAALACVLLALFANTFAYRTTITTVEYDDHAGRGSRGCREKIQEVDLSRCEQYVSGSRQQKLALRGIDNPQQQEIQQCCQQMRQVESQCQCDALQSIVKERTQQRRPERGQEEEQIMRRASEIQRQCGLPDCQF